MTAQTLGRFDLAIMGGRAVQALTVPASQLAEGDIIGGETWREVRSVVVYTGPDDERVCQFLAAPVGYGEPSRPAYLAADVQVAILRPTRVTVDEAYELLGGAIKAAEAVSAR